MKALLIAAIGMLGAQLALAETPMPPAKDEVVPRLRKGGYILFMRHAQTNPDQADTDPLNLENVKAQRQLSEAGRDDARAIGAAFRSLKVPVGRIVTSRFYRAQETGRLLGLGEIESSTDVTEGGLVVSPNENKRRAAALRKLLATAPSEGRNVIVVSHRPSLQEAAGKEFGDVGEAEVVIFEPLGDGKFRLLARVAPPSVWTEWAR